MAIIPAIGRKSRRLRLIIYGIYTILILGSITMVYPFLIMMSGSVKGNADVLYMDPFPKVFYSKQMQFARFQEERYPNLTLLSAAYSREILKIELANIPEIDEPELKRYHRFLEEKSSEFPDHFYLVQELTPVQKIMPRNFRMFRDEIRRESGTIDEFNERYETVLSSWNDFQGVLDSPVTKEFCYDNKPLVERYLTFKRSVPSRERVLLNIDGHYFNMQKHFPRIRSGELKPHPILHATCPPGDEGVLWTDFVKHFANCLFVRLDPTGLALFREYLVETYPGGVEELNTINETSYPSFDAVNATYDELANSAFFTVYTHFISNVCPVAHLRVDTPSTRYREYVGEARATAPFVAADYSVFGEVKKSFLIEVATRNYLNVLQFISIYGRAIFNTVVFIGLSILAALTVNPLAGYALSRFNLKSTYNILMFFLATMAFPGAVTMIPNFLLLKHFHLLNSFWALVLPGLANGYWIFILKGFFDSIPKEVYESAMIDGASEWTMFWKFTMALSKPILALMTLGAFTGAYTAFMFALIICPDERMWTLMVWLYQLQQDAHQSVIYAALVLAAIPTLLVFVLAQNTIMRGIVIPVEK